MIVIFDGADGVHQIRDLKKVYIYTSRIGDYRFLVRTRLFYYEQYLKVFSCCSFPFRKFVSFQKRNFSEMYIILHFPIECYFFLHQNISLPSPMYVIHKSHKTPQILSTQHFPQKFPSLFTFFLWYVYLK